MHITLRPRRGEVMSMNDNPMDAGRTTMGAGMAPEGGGEMDPKQPDLHTLHPDEQRARMAVTEPRAPMSESPPDNATSVDEIAHKEEAAKRGRRR
jgi:hypothetical protein